MNRHLLILSLLVASLCGHSRVLPAADSLRAREQQAMQAAVARVAPSVVRIETVGGLERVGEMLVGTGPTTGLVVSPRGHVVSSAFNFAQKPASILMTLADGSRHAAKLVATDRSRMLVLLKMEVEGELPVPEFAPRAEMRVGQWALAVGRTFEASQPNVSVGIVSAVDRIWGKALQTDAKISPNNYGGPLVDISGRVLGVLVPMSPDDTGDVAGVEWYDSGIGFAIPLEDVMHVLPKLEQGQDLQAGLLGISMKGANVYSDPVEVAAARATGPAYKAGFRAGDKIVEVGGTSVRRATELKHLLGRLYSGDKVRVVAERGDARIDREVELMGKIDPYEFPFLGILPTRVAKGTADAPLIVRYVYPDSPAAAAGINPGDRIRSLDGNEIKNAESLAQQLLALAPDTAVKLQVQRGDETLLLDTKLGRLPEAMPGEVPPARPETPAPAGERPAVGVVPIKTPEFANECIAYVPDGYRSDVPHGVVLWLHAPGPFKQDELIERWKPLCDERDFILLAPRAGEGGTWRATDVRFVRRVLDEVSKRYTIDPARVVVHGQEGGGALAYLFGALNLDVVRATAVVDAPLPRLASPPETDPVRRLAIYSALATKSEKSAAIESGIERLRALKYPVTVKELGEQTRDLTSEELAELVTWFDTLDRL